MKTQEKNIINPKYDFLSIQFPLLQYFWALIQNKIPEKNLYTEPNEDFGYEDDIHCTILWGITDENTLEKAQKVLDNYKPFTIQFEEITKFQSDDKYDVLKFDIYSPILEEIHEDLKKALDNKWEWPEYSPHITIAYVLPNSTNEILGNGMLTNRIITINKLQLKLKDGMIYKLNI